MHSPTYPDALYDPSRKSTRPADLNDEGQVHEDKLVLFPTTNTSAVPVTRIEKQCADIVDIEELIDDMREGRTVSDDRWAAELRELEARVRSTASKINDMSEERYRTIYEQIQHLAAACTTLESFASHKFFGDNFFGTGRFNICRLPSIYDPSESRTIRARFFSPQPQETVPTSGDAA
jgi:hypothetical protein